METPLTVSGELAQITMKDGTSLFAVLLNDIENPEDYANGIRYVRSNNLSLWLETDDEGLVEIIDPDHVDGIDLYLK